MKMNWEECRSLHQEMESYAPCNVFDCMEFPLLAEPTVHKCQYIRNICLLAAANCSPLRPQPSLPGPLVQTVSLAPSMKPFLWRVSYRQSSIGLKCQEASEAYILEPAHFPPAWIRRTSNRWSRSCTTSSHVGCFRHVRRTCHHWQSARGGFLARPKFWPCWVSVSGSLSNRTTVSEIEDKDMGYTPTT